MSSSQSNSSQTTNSDSTTARSYDSILLGSSVNALTAAAYLARAGKRVLVLESSAQLGGVMASTEVADGFHADLALMSGRLDANIIRELQLTEHGLEVIERNTITSLLPGQQSFTLPSDRKAATAVIRSFSSADAERYESFLQLLDLAGNLLKSAYEMSPADMHNPSPDEAARLLQLAGQLRGYGRREMTEVMRLLVMSARDLLDEWFESAPLQGLFGSLAIRGLMQGPFAGGTAFNLLHHLAIGDGLFRATAKGGLGGICQALAAAATSYGAQFRTGVGALKLVLSDNVATGVRLENGEQLDAAQIISDYDARYTFTRLINPAELEPEFNRAVALCRYNGAVARVNLALTRLPEFTGISENNRAEALRGTLLIAPGLNQLEKAFDAAKYGELPSQPYLEATIPTLTDPTLAPAGAHVISIWLQYLPYRGNYDARQVGELALTRLSEFAPDLRDCVQHAQVLMPEDFAERCQLSEGHLYGGDMSLSQAFFLRPIPGYAQYRTPVENLYLCGSATHPGGGVSGLAGRNLAEQLKTE